MMGQIGKLMQSLYSKVGVESERTRNISTQIILSIIYKGGSVVSSFLIVPLTMSYLDNYDYGLWLTISSFIAWFSFFDIGLGNGLRNKFTEARAQSDMSLAKSYVSTAYISIGFISLTLVVIFLCFCSFINWSSLLNSSPDRDGEIVVLMPLVFGFFCMQLVLGLITTIYSADQRSSVQGKINFIIQASSLICVWILSRFIEGSLFIFGAVYSSLPVIVLLIFTFISYNGKYRDFAPGFRSFQWKFLREIFGLGINFFIIQVAGIIIFSTDSILISNILSPAEVVPYQIAFKYLSVCTMLYSIAYTPFWSAFTDAYTRNDNGWIKTALKKLRLMSYGFSAVCLILVAISGFVYNIWLGKDHIAIPLLLTVMLAIYVIQNIILTPYTLFLNGIGKISVQTYHSIFAAIINIPLCYLFAAYFHMGTSGIVLGTVVSMMPGIFLAPYQTHQILGGRAKGIFNR